MTGRRTRRTAKQPGPKGLFAPYFLLALLILAGVLVGALLAPGQAQEPSNGLGIFSQQLLSSAAADNHFWDLFFSSFFSTAVLLCAAFLLGLWAAGAVGIVLVALFKGTGIGLSMGVIYIHYGVSGFLICALFILPWALITSFAVVVACREGLQFSLRMARAVSPAGAGHLWQMFRMYCLRYVICFGLAAAAAVVEAGSVLAFATLFL